MHNTERLARVSKKQKIFQNLLLLYPEQYRKKFGQEMSLVFEDLYQEKFIKDGNAGVFFWLVISLDIIKNSFEQHRELLHKQGMRKYTQKTLHINKYNIIGLILLLPFFSVFLIDTIARIAQGDLTHYNRPVYALLSHSLLYWFPVLFTWVIIFPSIAILLNVIPLLKDIQKRHNDVFHFSFAKRNTLSLFILIIGIGFLAIIKLHDFAPCVVHGIFRFGLEKVPYIISFCSNV